MKMKYHRSPVFCTSFLHFCGKFHTAHKSHFQFSTCWFVLQQCSKSFPPSSTTFTYFSPGKVSSPSFKSKFSSDCQQECGKNYNCISHLLFLFLFLNTTSYISIYGGYLQPFSLPKILAINITIRVNLEKFEYEKIGQRTTLNLLY